MFHSSLREARELALEEGARDPPLLSGATFQGSAPPPRAGGTWFAVSERLVFVGFRFRASLGACLGPLGVLACASEICIA